jgi:prolyl 4-hydroxylase
MDAGEMILYESHSIIHGRPFPMKGRFYANIFIHFEPVGHSLRHNVKVDALENEGSLQEKYRKSIELGHGGHENSQLPVYILPDTPAAQSWIASHPGGMQEESVCVGQEIRFTFIVSCC